MKKLRAGSLQMVTLIIVVIALLLSSVVMLTHIHKQFRLQTFHVVETVRLTNQGMLYALSETIETRDTVEIPSFGEEHKSLKVKKSFWGVFEKVYAEAQIKNRRFHKMALIGSRHSDQKTALFLKDNNNPLVVVGNTDIRGLTYLPKRGSRTGNINGVPYYGTQHVYGKTKTSVGFPKLPNDMRKHITTLVGSPFVTQEGFTHLDLNGRKKVVNLFNNALLFAYSQLEISLSEIELSGHIIIRSDTRIIIDKTSKLTDVVLIAPYIEIRENVKGTFQALATNNIIVSENVQLDYPSALVLIGDYQKQDGDSKHNIEIKSKTKVKGSVLCLGKTTPDNYEVQLKIESNVEIEGDVLCEQNIELRGAVYGSVYANNFIVRENGTTYQNHLFNAKINIAEQTEQYVGLVMDNAPKDFMKWLY